MLNDKLVRWFLRPTPSSGLSLITEMPIAVGTHVGYVRKENQDRVAAMRVNANSASSPTFLVVAIADGMGGMINGAECAARTLATFFNSMIRFRLKPAEERLILAAEDANRLVNEYSNGRGGATLSALLIDANFQVFTLNVGDSRIYARLDSDAENVMRLTTDDSLEDAVGGHGRELLQFIGMGEGLIPHVSKPSIGLDRALLTSDGVHFVGHEQLSDVLIHSENPNQVVDRLITLAKWRGAPDNASAAAVFLPQLRSMLPMSEDSGVEVWDSFSAIHIMWVKQDQEGMIHEVVADIKDKRTSSCEHLENALQMQSKENLGKASCVAEQAESRQKNNKKARSTKGVKSARPLAQSPQLTIEIEPFGVEVKDKDGDDAPSK